MVFLNFIILEKINKIFIQFLGLLNKSRFGITSDDCVWGFTVSYTQLSYFSTKMRKNFVKGKNWLFSSRNFLLFSSPLSPSFVFAIYLNFFFQTIYSFAFVHFYQNEIFSAQTEQQTLFHCSYWGGFFRSESVPNIISTKAEKENIN